jgi:hypothetical protein
MEGLFKGGQGPISGCCAIEVEECILMSDTRDDRRQDGTDPKRYVFFKTWKKLRKLVVENRKLSVLEVKSFLFCKYARNISTFFYI